MVVFIQQPQRCYLHLLLFGCSLLLLLLLSYKVAIVLFYFNWMLLPLLACPQSGGNITKPKQNGTNEVGRCWQETVRSCQINWNPRKMLFPTTGPIILTQFFGACFSEARSGGSLNNSIRAKLSNQGRKFAPITTRS